MSHLFGYIRSFVQDDRVLLFITLFVMTLKGYYLVYFYSKHCHSQRTVYLRRVLTIALLCSLVVDFAWVVAFCRDLPLIGLPFSLDYNLTRLSWIAYFTYSQTIAFFVLYLTQKEVKISVKQYIHFIPSLLLSGVYVIYMIYYYQSLQTTPNIHHLRLIAKLYNYFVLIIPSIICATQRSRHKNFPRILARQASWSLFAFVIPFAAFELFAQLARYVILIDPSIFNIFNTISTLLFTIGVYIGGKRISQLRFLNLQDKVTSSPRATFVTEVKKISDDLNATTSTSELPHIIKLFFYNAFDIPTNRTHFYINWYDHDGHDPIKPLSPSHNGSERHSCIKQFFVENKDEEIVQRLKQHEILVMDELVFSNFYEHNPVQEKLISLLEKINADLLLPIFKKDAVVACIVVDRYARKNQLYSNVESDEMVVFANNIGNMVNILQNQNLEIVAKKEREIRQQLHSEKQSIEAEKQNLQGKLYHIHQENNQYKESLRTFLRNSHQTEIGILFYKNRRFSCANQAAQTIIDINLNKYPGHPLVKSMTCLARGVEKYKAAQSSVINNSKGERLVVSAIPNSGLGGVIIVVQPPGVSDLIKKQMDLLKDPQHWDYLLYLETTKSGRLINELVPGSSESILNFKVSLLKAALSKQASLIVATNDDVEPLVKMLHQISLREHLKIMKIHESEKNSDTAIKLFGANKLIYSKELKPPILKTLDKNGTLHIENVHYLTPDAQKQLAEYILYGYFNPVHSNEKIVSDVRIICSTDQDLQSLVQDGLFDARLYKAVRDTLIEMPSFTDLDRDELRELTESIVSHSLKGTELETLVGLSEADKTRITHNRPVSFIKLQDRIKTLLIRKSKNSPISYDSSFDEANESDPVILQALQLGRKALRNDALMRALWDKLRSQSRIANLLGVNRSSVSRRCHKLGLLLDENSASKSELEPNPPSKASQTGQAQ